MKTRLLLSAVVLTTGLSIAAIAQTQQQDHEEHHPPGAPPQTQAAPPPAPPAPPPAAQAPSTQPQMPMDMGQMMQRMPEQCRAMMQNMPQNCMSMMQQMMQGRMGMMPGGTQAQPTNQSAAPRPTWRLPSACMRHARGAQASDPDVAFVRAMIAHHQGAIDMAKVVLQYGKDNQTKKWANDVIREQQREISEREEWLKKNAR